MKALPKFTFAQFKERFPNDDVCLHHLFLIRYQNIAACPNCQKGFDFVRVKERRSYQCTQCAFQLYPTAGTIFHKSTTPLTTWFHALYMFCVTRNGVAAMELERSFDICHETALRIAHKIKELMTEVISDMEGVVEMDETYLGGSDKGKHLNSKRMGDKKTIVFGMIQKGGKAVSDVVPDTKSKTLLPIIKSVVQPHSTIVTDSSQAYYYVHKNFRKHVVVNHDKKEFTDKNGYTTNHVENYWMHLKRMIKGSHIHVSNKHLPKYLAEHSFRYNHRSTPDKMFDIALNRIAK